MTEATCGGWPTGCTTAGRTGPGSGSVPTSAWPTPASRSPGASAPTSRCTPWTDAGRSSSTARSSTGQPPRPPRPPVPHRSDAEVVLAGLAVEGISFIERLHGQFAFVAHDLRTNTTHLVRDRLGILPLHYRHVPGRHRVRVGGQGAARRRPAARGGPPQPGRLPRHPDRARARHPLRGREEGAARAPRRHLRGRAPRGDRLTGRPRTATPRARGAADDAIEAVGDGVREAVRTALSDTVPVGVHLSGGLDSSLIAAQAQHLLATPAPHLRHRARRRGGRPRELARRVAELLGTVTTRCPSHRSSSRPVGTSDLAPRRTDLGAGRHRGVRHRPCRSRARRRDAVRTRRRRALRRRSNIATTPRRAIPPVPAVLRGGRLGVVERRLETFTAAERQRLLGDAAPPDRRTTPTPGSDPVDRMLRHDLRHDLPDHLLERGDRMSKAASLEVRPALLDHHLVELAFRLPTSVKVRSGSTGWVLREAARPLLPDEVIDPRPSRRRHGSHLDDEVRDLLHDRLTGSGRGSRAPSTAGSSATCWRAPTPGTSTRDSGRCWGSRSGTTASSVPHRRATPAARASRRTPPGLSQSHDLPSGTPLTSCPPRVGDAGCGGQGGGPRPPPPVRVGCPDDEGGGFVTSGHQEWPVRAGPGGRTSAGAPLRA